jgi:hypothetical protein
MPETSCRHCRRNLTQAEMQAGICPECGQALRPAAGLSGQITLKTNSSSRSGQALGPAAGPSPLRLVVVGILALVVVLGVVAVVIYLKGHNDAIRLKQPELIGSMPQVEAEEAEPLPAPRVEEP